MRLALTILVLVSGDGWAALGAREATSHGRRGHIPLNERRAACKKLCSKYYTDGSEERQCLVDCRVRIDLAHANAEKALRNFADHQLGAEDEAYNGMLGERGCTPLVPTAEIDFRDMDLDDDGAIVPSELVTVGSLLCIPDGMLRQLFMDMDTNSDRRISYTEWRKAGEDTVYEYEVDKIADQKVNGSTSSTQQESERALKELLAEVRAPDFEALDADGDGFLCEWEMVSGFMRELIQRDPTMSRDLRRHMLELFRMGLGRLMTLLDTNRDGRISPSEYIKAKGKSDLGDEVKELGRHLMGELPKQEPQQPHEPHEPQEQLLQRALRRVRWRRRSPAKAQLLLSHRLRVRPRAPSAGQ